MAGKKGAKVAGLASLKRANSSTSGGRKNAENALRGVAQGARLKKTAGASGDSIAAGKPLKSAAKSKGGASKKSVR